MIHLNGVLLVVVLLLAYKIDCIDHNNKSNETAPNLENLINDNDVSNILENDSPETNITTVQNDTTTANSRESIVKKNGVDPDRKYIPGLTELMFKDIDGFKIKDLTNANNYPDTPDETNAVSDINRNEDDSQSFGVKIFGYLKLPEDGEYVFKLSCKGGGRFSLSTGSDKANLRIYASVDGRQVLEPGNFDKYENQKSSPVLMKAGTMYYFEVLYKSLFGPDHLQLGATFPDGSKHYPLEVKFFFTLKDIKGDGSGTGGGGAGAEGGDGGGGGEGGSGTSDPLAAALKAGKKAGLQNGEDAGAQAGENAGKQAGGDAGAKAGAVAGLKAAAEILGLSIEQLKEQKAAREASKRCGLKFRMYSANFKCSKPGGHICKHALSTEEDNSVKLNPRESATTFILRRPGLNGKLNSISFEVDSKRGYFLTKDGNSFTTAINDGSNAFGAQSSFLIDSQDDFSPSSYGIKLFDKVDNYLCHNVGTSDVSSNKLSANCAFHMVPPELDMNVNQPSCKDFCSVEEDDSVSLDPMKEKVETKPAMTPAQRKGATVETLHLLNALAEHAAHVTSEHMLADHSANVKLEAERIASNHALKEYNVLLHNQGQSSHDEGENLHETATQHFIQIHFKNNAGSDGTTKIISSIKPEGYILGSDVFTLKIIFKHHFADMVIFHGIDESSSGRKILLNGKKQLSVHPSVSSTDFIDVIVTSDPPFNHIDDGIVIGHKDLSSMETGHNSTSTHPVEIPNNLPTSQPVLSHPDVRTNSKGITKADVPDVVEIAYDEDNAQKKTITEIHVPKYDTDKKLLNEVDPQPHIIDSSNTYAMKKITVEDPVPITTFEDEQEKTLKESLMQAAEFIKNKKRMNPLQRKNSFQDGLQDTPMESHNIESPTGDLHKKMFTKVFLLPTAKQLHNSSTMETISKTGVSEKKTIMGNTVLKPTKPVSEDADAVVTKKTIMATIQQLEENNYRAKLKTLNNFLKRYTDKDAIQKKRYDLWLSKHKHPRSWYFGYPVNGYKRSSYFNNNYYYHHPVYGNPSTVYGNPPAVVHEDDIYTKRSMTHPINTWSKPVTAWPHPFYNYQLGPQIHDDKRQNIPQAVRRQFPVNPYMKRQSRHKRSLCNCDMQCDNQNFNNCIKQCESECKVSKENSKRSSVEYLNQENHHKLQDDNFNYRANKYIQDFANKHPQYFYSKNYKDHSRNNYQEHSRNTDKEHFRSYIENQHERATRNPYYTQSYFNSAQYSQNGLPNAYQYGSNSKNEFDNSGYMRNLYDKNSKNGFTRAYRYGENNKKLVSNTYQYGQSSLMNNYQYPEIRSNMYQYPNTKTDTYQNANRRIGIYQYPNTRTSKYYTNPLLSAYTMNPFQAAYFQNYKKSYQTQTKTYPQSYRKDRSQYYTSKVKNNLHKGNGKSAQYYPKSIVATPSFYNNYARYSNSLSGSTTPYKWYSRTSVPKKPLIKNSKISRKSETLKIVHNKTIQKNEIPKSLHKPEKINYKSLIVISEDAKKTTNKTGIVPSVSFSKVLPAVSTVTALSETLNATRRSDTPKRYVAPVKYINDEESFKKIKNINGNKRSFNKTNHISDKNKPMTNNDTAKSVSKTILYHNSSVAPNKMLSDALYALNNSSTGEVKKNKTQGSARTEVLKTSNKSYNAEPQKTGGEMNSTQSVSKMEKELKKRANFTGSKLNETASTKRYIYKRPIRLKTNVFFKSKSGIPFYVRAHKHSVEHHATGNKRFMNLKIGKNNTVATNATKKFSTTSSLKETFQKFLNHEEDTDVTNTTVDDKARKNVTTDADDKQITDVTEKDKSDISDLKNNEIRDELSDKSDDVQVKALQVDKKEEKISQEKIEGVDSKEEKAKEMEKSDKSEAKDDEIKSESHLDDNNYDLKSDSNKGEKKKPSALEEVKLEIEKEERDREREKSHNSEQNKEIKEKSRHLETEKEENHSEVVDAHHGKSQNIESNKEEKEQKKEKSKYIETDKEMYPSSVTEKEEHSDTNQVKQENSNEKESKQENEENVHKNESNEEHSHDSKHNEETLLKKKHKKETSNEEDKPQNNQSGIQNSHHPEMEKDTEKLIYDNDVTSLIDQNGGGIFHHHKNNTDIVLPFNGTENTKEQKLKNPILNFREENVKNTSLLQNTNSVENVNPVTTGNKQNSPEDKITEHNAANPHTALIPKEIESVYSDRVDNDGYMRGDGYGVDDINHDTINGDWFDAGFHPDATTTQDLSMSKSRFFTKLGKQNIDRLAKTNQFKGEANSKQIAVSQKQVEAKINNIVKVAESSEQSELQNLITESIGTANENTANTNENAIGTANENSASTNENINTPVIGESTISLNTKDVNKNSTDPGSQEHYDVDIENESVKIKGENGDIEKILADYKDEFTMNQQDNNGLYEDKADILKELKEHDQQEIDDLKTDLDDSVESNNKNDTNGSETNESKDVLKEKKTDNLVSLEKDDGKHAARSRQKPSLHEAMEEITPSETEVLSPKETDGLPKNIDISPKEIEVSTKETAKAVPVLASKGKAEIIPNKNIVVSEDSDDNIDEIDEKETARISQKETTEDAFPLFKDKKYRKHDLQSSKEKSDFEKINEKWQKVIEENKHLSDDINEKPEGKTKLKSDTKENVLTSYFKEVEKKQQGVDKGAEMNKKQQKRQKKIKATLAMINDIETQIDGMINDKGDRKLSDADDKSKIKKKGKAAIFSELIKGSDKNEENLSGESTSDNKEEEDIKHLKGSKKEFNKYYNTARNAETKELETHVAKAISEDIDELGSEEKKKEEELEDGDSIDELDDDFHNTDDSHDNELLKDKHKYHYQKDDTEQESDEDDFPKKHAQSLRHRQNFQQRRHHPQVEHVDGNSIANAIAAKDRKIRIEQAATLMNLQKQEVKDDLIKLKEVTQDGLQSMFAKAVAKQQKFMADIEGPQDNGRDELVARDQLQNDPANAKLYDDQDEQKTIVPIDNDQIEVKGRFASERHSYNEPHSNYDDVDYEDEMAGRKSRIMSREIERENERDTYDDDIIDSDGENDEEADERDNYYDSDEDRRRIV